MTIPSRVRVVLPGASAVGLLGLGATWLSVSSFFTDPTPQDVLVFGSAVVSAPMFLVWEWFRRGGGSLSTETLVFAFVAIAAVPAHPIFDRTWAAVLTIIGLIAWLVCTLIVAGGPA